MQIMGTIMGGIDFCFWMEVMLYTTAISIAMSFKARREGGEVIDGLNEMKISIFTQDEFCDHFRIVA